jgi:hypothetical protein
VVVDDNFAALIVKLEVLGLANVGYLGFADPVEHRIVDRDCLVEVRKERSTSLGCTIVGGDVKSIGVKVDNPGGALMLEFGHEDVVFLSGLKCVILPFGPGTDMLSVLGEGSLQTQMMFLSADGFRERETCEERDECAE